ncbi:MAG TPA: hypothetical protein VII49_06020 [Rhizomicrobium sp.]
MIVLALSPVAGQVFAAVTISSAATQNMSCANGVCVPTANNAVLNVADLETLLASGNATVTTTGSGGIQADDIDVKAGISWTSTGVLSFNAWRSVAVSQPIAVNGASGLSVLTNGGGAGGMLSFSSGANVSFLDLASSLSVNGAAYTLENSIAALATAIAANPGGNYALANNYDASHDGTYSNSPIPTEFSGNFEGLGNTISNLSITAPANTNTYVGLFAEIGSGNESGGTLADIALRKLRINGQGIFVGGLVGRNDGAISGASVEGSIQSDNTNGSAIGCLAYTNVGSITLSSAGCSVTSVGLASNGGLVSGNDGVITQSYATGAVKSGASGGAGGVVDYNQGSITESYATGAVTAGKDSAIGTFIGHNRAASTSQTYGTGYLKATNKNPDKGGYVGDDTSPPGSIASAYWDTTTSGFAKLGRGAGNIKNDPGITGLTTTQLQAGLPAGFDPTIWAETPSINNGLPYLIANPPEKK